MIAAVAALLLLLPCRQEPDLAAEIDRLLEQPGLKPFKIGVEIRSAGPGPAVVYSKNAGEPFQLASNTKLLTCAAALDRLGPDHNFVTVLHAENPEEAAAGALVVTGTGDPHISGRDFGDNPTAIFEKWAKEAKKQGIERINGPIKLVADKFMEETTHPGWNDYSDSIHRWWMAPFAQFSLNDNCIDVLYAPGPAAGAPGRLTVLPDTRFVTVANKTSTVQSKGRVAFQFWRTPGTNNISFRGDLALTRDEARTWVAIQDPMGFFGTVLKETFEKEGIPIAGGVEIVRAEPEGLKVLARHESPLSRALEVCLTNSQNFYAEMIFLHLGWKLHGKGTTENAVRAVRGLLEEIGMEKVDQKDGSGLTRENLASPRDLVLLLRHMLGHKHAGVFHAALAVNGAETGTLRRRMRGEDLKGRVHAKTGHIGGVSTLSGYVKAADDTTYIFSILLNREASGGTSAADKLQDQICELLIRHKDD